jgi:hypothetical protein
MDMNFEEKEMQEERVPTDEEYRMACEAMEKDLKKDGNFILEKKTKLYARLFLFKHEHEHDCKGCASASAPADFKAINDIKLVFDVDAASKEKLAQRFLFCSVTCTVSFILTTFESRIYALAWQDDHETIKCVEAIPMSALEPLGYHVYFIHQCYDKSLKPFVRAPTDAHIDIDDKDEDEDEENKGGAGKATFKELMFEYGCDTDQDDA